MNDQNISTVLSDDGLLVASMDMPGRSMNVFSLDMMDSLENLIIHVEENEKIKAVVLTSKKSTFLVGADLSMIKMFTERAQTDTHDQLVDLCGRLGRVFRRLETSVKPYVAALNGMALGGGLELSMACHARVASDRKDVMLGLPEIKLGLLPGAGGTQRLPKLVGAKQGLRMLLIGEPIHSLQAKQHGLVDDVVTDEQLVIAASKKALSMGKPCPPWDNEKSEFDSADLDFEEAEAHSRIAKMLDISEKDVITKYPAYEAIMSCVTQGWSQQMDSALSNEMDIFVKLIQDPVAGNMVRSLFLNRQLSLKPTINNLDPRTTKVSIIGDDVNDLSEKLTKGRAEVVDESELTSTDIALITNGKVLSSAIYVKWLKSNSDKLDGACLGVWISDKTQHGASVEIIKSADTIDVDAGLVLSKWLRATAILISQREDSFLSSLSMTNNTTTSLDCTDSDVLLAQSLCAINAWLTGTIENIEVADSACVVAGLTPSYTGGPFNYAIQQGEVAIQKQLENASVYKSDLFKSPKDLSLFFKQFS